MDNIYIGEMFFYLKYLAVDDYDAMKNHEIASLEKAFVKLERVNINGRSFYFTFNFIKNRPGQFQILVIGKQ